MSAPARDRIRRRWGSPAGAETVLRSPAYLGALLFHAVILLLLSGWTIVAYVVEEPAEVTVKLLDLREAAAPVPDRDALLAGLELAETTPSVDVDLSYDEAQGNEPGIAAATGPAQAMGLSGAAGFGRGGGSDARGGPTGESGAALASGLAWLSRHRSGDGGWGYVSVNGRSNHLPPGSEPGHTGLALLAFLMAGHEPGKPGLYGQLVREVRDWLVGRVGPDGHVVTGNDTGYVQAIVTLTLAEALARGEDPRVRDAVVRAARCIERWQAPGGGFRYQPREAGDTSVTGWMALALRSAEHAGVAVDPEVWKGVRTYVEGASDASGGTGYMGRGGGSAAMNATGLFLRVLLGEPPTTARNVKAAERVAREVGEVAPGRADLYHLYYAQLALFQVGGEPWTTVNPRVRDGLVRGAVRGGCEDGCWAKWRYDPVLATSFAVLCLETYFRYLPVHGGAGPAATDPVFDNLCAASLALERAREGAPAELLVAEAAGEEALRLVAELPEQERKRRAVDISRLLLQVALEAGDPTRLEARLRAHDELVPPDEAPDPGIEEIRREMELQCWRKRLRAALGKAGEATARRALKDELAARRTALAGEVAQAAPKRRGFLETLAAALGPLEDQLAVAVAMDGGADPAALLAATPTEGPVQQAERTLIGHLVASAADAVERGALEEQEAHLTRLRARKLLERLPAGDPLRDVLGQLEAACLVRMARAGRHPEVLEGVREWWRVHSREQGGAQVERAELEALLALFRAGKSDGGQRERLCGLLLAHSKEAPPTEAATLLRAAGELFLRQGEEEAGRQLLTRARELVGGAESVELTLVNTRNNREAGKADQAMAALTMLAPKDRQRVDVKREVHLTLLALGRAREALPDAQQLLRALPEDTPEWWDAVDDLARLQVGVGDAPAARTLVEGARRRFPALGGEERKKKVIALMHWLDTLR